MGKFTMALILTAGLLLALPLGAAPAAGTGRQTPPGTASGSPSTLWLGCWEREAPQEPNASALRVCVEQQGARITFRTLANDSTVLEETFATDGKTQPVEASGCHGTQQAVLPGGRLLLARSDVTCDGRPRQVVSRISLLQTSARWLDVVVVETGGRETVYVRSYQRVGVGPQQGQQIAVKEGVATLTLDGLKYAASFLSPRAVEAVIAETRPVFKLSGRTLVDLKDAGVPSALIDLIVATSLPDRFEVSGGSQGGGGGFGGFPIGITPAVPYAAEWGLPLWMFDDGYWYWGSCGYWNCLGPGYPIDPGEPGEGGSGSVHGRVVAGMGYARVWPRESEAQAGGGQRGGQQGSSSDSGGQSSGSSQGSSVASDGYSRGGGTDTGRTAEPRTPPPSPPPHQ